MSRNPEEGDAAEDAVTAGFFNLEAKGPDQKLVGLGDVALVQAPDGITAVGEDVQVVRTALRRKRSELGDGDPNRPKLSARLLVLTPNGAKSSQGGERLSLM